MTRLGTSSTAEHRQLAVKVASLLVDWQKQSFDEGSVIACKPETDQSESQ